MACRLKQKLNFGGFRIFERGAGIGGTWFKNQYPGVACDVPTVFYSLSIAPNYTSKTVFPSGAEYLDYLHGVVKRFDIADHIDLNVEVEGAQWIESEQEWELEVRRVVSDGSEARWVQDEHELPRAEKRAKIRAKVVVSAVGILTRPSHWPERVSDREAYTGKVLQPVQWPEEIELSGKDIVLVGSGCTAAQIAPALLETDIKSLTHIMRTAPWILPRTEEPGGRKAYAKYAPKVFGTVPLLGLMVRTAICWLSELLWFVAFQRRNVKLRKLIETSCLDHMRKLSPTKYHAMLTPGYSLGGKRRVFDNDWLKSMHDPRYILTMQELLGMSEKSVRVAQCKPQAGAPPLPNSYPADILVLATGYQATRFLNGLSLVGCDGRDLRSIWAERGGAQAYMGTSIDGFPNFFMIMGPNTFVGHTSVTMSIESSVELILKLIAPILSGEVVTLEPTQAATEQWSQGIKEDMKETVFDGCPSWYNANGLENSVMYPRSQLDFYLRCRFPVARDWHRLLSAKGRQKGLASRTLSLVALGSLAALASCAVIWAQGGEASGGAWSRNVMALVADIKAWATATK